MKKFIFALAAALLIAVQFLTPVSAASATSSSCGDTYTVQHLDNLSKIASYCDTTVADILALNPTITNPNIIFTGQVLNLTGSGTVTTTYTSSSTYTVQSGDTLAEIASDYGITVWALMQANPSLWSTGVVYTGQVLYIPGTSSSSTYTYTGYARVTVSDTTVDAGDTVTVYVRGFPANSYIDYRVGESGEDYVSVYDGTVDEDGEASETITIPSSADEGEYWVVLVTTTSQKECVDVSSPTIYITD